MPGSPGRAFVDESGPRPTEFRWPRATGAIRHTHGHGRPPFADEARGGPTGLTRRHTRSPEDRTHDSFPSSRRSHLATQSVVTRGGRPCHPMIDGSVCIAADCSSAGPSRRCDPSRSRPKPASSAWHLHRAGFRSRPTPARRLQADPGITGCPLVSERPRTFLDAHRARVQQPRRDAWRWPEYR